MPTIRELVEGQRNVGEVARMTRQIYRDQRFQTMVCALNTKNDMEERKPQPRIRYKSVEYTR
jgi:hypothetical protein